MKKKLLFGAVVITLVLGFVIGALAQGGPRRFSDEKLWEIARSILDTDLGANLSREQEELLDKLASQFTEEDVYTLIRFVLILRGYSLEEGNEIIEGLKKEKEDHEETLRRMEGGSDEQGLRPLSGPCAQMVEEQEGFDGTRSDYVAESQWCDGAPDMDYHFRFYLWWTGDPDLIRWYSDSGWVRFIFRNSAKLTL